jgi:hypothetical protein
MDPAGAERVAGRQVLDQLRLLAPDAGPGAFPAGEKRDFTAGVSGQGAMMPRVGFAFVSWAGTLVFFGLTILGRGWLRRVLRPALTVLAIAGVVLVVVALFSRGNLSPGEREDRGDRWVLITFALVWLLAGYLPAYTDRKELWTLDG